MSTGNPVDIFEPVISAIKAKIEELQKALENIEALRAGGVVGATSLGSTLGAAQQSGNAFSNDAFFGMTVAEAARKYLSAMKKTATVNAICDALLAGGWKTSAKNVPEMVRTILYRTPEFVRINGEFGLAEWYPGRKVLKYRPATSVAEPAGAATADEDSSEKPLMLKAGEINLS